MVNQMDFNKFLFNRRRGGGGRPKTAQLHVMLHDIEHKSCSDCGSLKPLSYFHKDSSTGDGLHSRCQVCANSAKKAKRKDK